MAAVKVPAATIQMFRARSFASAAPAAKKAAVSDMMCFQCEQTEDNKGCKSIGVCGKTPEVAALQDLLLHHVKGVSRYAARASALGDKYFDPALDRFMFQALFSTMTNVNFDAARMVDYLKEAEQMRDTARDLYLRACKEQKAQPQNLTDEFSSFSLPAGLDKKIMLQQARDVGLEARKARDGDVVVGLQEMAFLGLKGTVAYAEHAALVGFEDPSIAKEAHAIVDALCEPNPKADALLELSMRVGRLNLKVMELLDTAHRTKFGTPEPTMVNTTPQPGLAILVSGHDIEDVHDLLMQTEGTGIKVYTHGELLPAHSYPNIKKFKHLAGHYGGPWNLQKLEFAAFPGSILMTTNCLIEPMRSYKERIFTANVVGWPGIQHVGSGKGRKDFSQVIAAAKKAKGYTAADVAEATSAPLMIGFGHNAVLGVADKVVDAVKAGAIKRFFVIGGCDGSEGERSYFTELAQNLPKDTIILTMGCGKFRLNRLNLGDIGGIPRLLDMGQCNDSHSGVVIASALAKAFNTEVNSLPLSFAISWFEQKAVACLLSLLALNIQNIRLGPALPAFCTPAMFKILQDKFNLRQIAIKDVKADMQLMMAGK